MSEGRCLGGVGVGGLDQTLARFSLGSPYSVLEPPSPRGCLLLQPLALTLTLTGLALPEPLGWRLRVLGLGFQDRLQRWGGVQSQPGDSRQIPLLPCASVSLAVKWGAVCAPHA